MFIRVFTSLTDEIYGHDYLPEKDSRFKVDTVVVSTLNTLVIANPKTKILPIKCILKWFIDSSSGLFAELVI